MQTSRIGVEIFGRIGLDEVINYTLNDFNILNGLPSNLPSRTNMIFAGGFVTPVFFVVEGDAAANVGHISGGIVTGVVFSDGTVQIDTNIVSQIGEVNSSFEIENNTKLVLNMVNGPNNIYGFVGLFQLVVRPMPTGIGPLTPPPP